MKEDYISLCCGVSVEYGKHYCMFALRGEESFRCPRCKEDPCGVKGKKGGQGDKKIVSHNKIM